MSQYLSHACSISLRVLISSAFMITVSTPVDLLGLGVEAAGVVGLEAVLGVELVVGGATAVLDRLVAGRVVLGALIELLLKVGLALGLAVGLGVALLLDAVVVL